MHPYGLTLLNIKIDNINKHIRKEEKQITCHKFYEKKHLATNTANLKKFSPYYKNFHLFMSYT